MAIDMNGDIGEIFKNIFSKKTSNDNSLKNNPKKPSNPFIKIVAAGGIVFLLIILYLFVGYFPTQEENRIKRENVALINDLNTCIAEISDDIVSASKELNFAQSEYKRLTKLFHTGQELDDLYRHISMLALSNQLMVLKINKVGEYPVFEAKEALLDGGMTENFDMAPIDDMGQNSNTSACDIFLNRGGPLIADDSFNDQDFQDPMLTDNVSGAWDEREAKPQKVAYYELKVGFEISGNYAKYTNFREGLAELKKIINITKEKIIVLQSENKKGEVKVETIFSIYRIPVTELDKYALPQKEIILGDVWPD
jgi:Tfp pilus assembly protein PilO